MEQSFTAFGSLLESVKEQRLRATSLPEPQRSLARAKAFLELGAYLRAARALREAYQVAPDDPAVRMTYLEALVNARLETDAKAVAEKTFAPEQVKAELDAAEHRVSSRTAHAIPPPPDERWWLRPPGVREE
jgi:thioredoxin-like negative regulator of GroEL